MIFTLHDIVSGQCGPSVLIMQGAANERQVFYMVTEPYSPYTNSSQELAVEAGDVIQVGYIYF